MTTAYASVADLRAYLKQTPVDAATTATLQDVLDRASAFVDGEIGHGWFTTTTGTRTIYGDGTSYLQLPVDYVAGSVTTVTTTTDFTVPNYIEQGGMLIAASSTGQIIAPQYRYPNYSPYSYDWIAGWRTGIPYTVAATFGYGDVPTDLVEVVLEVAAYIWTNKDTGFSTVRGVEGGAAVNIRSSITPLARDILDHHTPDKKSAGVW